VLAELSWRDLVPAIWLPDPTIRRERELARFRLHLGGHRTTLKNRIHATLIAFGHPCAVCDLFGLAGRELLDRLQIPDPWRRNVDVSLGLIDDLEVQIAQLTVQLKRMGADHRYVPLLVTAPGFGWINAFTVASEIGDINRFASPAKLCRSTGPCPRVIQSGATDTRGPISKHGPLPALGAVRGRDERLQAPPLPGALPTHQAPPGPPARPQGRPDRPLAQTDRSDLAHAHPQPTLRSGRRPLSPSRPTAPFGNAPPQRASRSARSPRHRGDPDMSAAHHHTARGP
jgi:Transposase IS116/IS110/IS902 family